MGQGNVAYVAFNRGMISPLALGRTDLKRQPLSAEIQTNWMPRTLGCMSLRPGLQYKRSTYNDSYAQHIPFIYSVSDMAEIELTNLKMRVAISDTIITRVSVATAVTNGDFTSNVTGWTDADEAGADSGWETGGYMYLAGTAFNAAIRTQTVTVAGGDFNKEHAFRIVVQRGPVTLRVGSTSGGDEYIAETTLLTGTHSLAFTPTATNVFVRLSNRNNYKSLVDSINVEAAGAMEITTPWTTANLPLVRSTQSADVVFCACDGLQQRRIERRSARSWSLVVYDADDGPFRLLNTTGITITPSSTNGDITLTSSAPLFKSTQVGGLFRLTSTGQIVNASLGGADQYTDPVKVTGLSANNGRLITIVITGTWVGTLYLQRSVGDIGAWTDVGTTYTANTSTSYNDALDNQIIYYRIGFKPLTYTSGTAAVQISFPQGSIDGIARITSFSTNASVGARVLRNLGSTTATSNWSEGEWSDFRGYPSALTLFEGRLWFAGKNKIFGSVSDAYSSFDDTVDGDSGPISRSIGSGPVDTINWMLDLPRLQIGAQMAEYSAVSSGLDEPLTATNFSLKAPSTQGSDSVQAVKLDTNGIFVQRSGTRVLALGYNSDNYQYTNEELTVFCPEIGEPSIVKIAIQRQPDTRIHCVRSDGKVAILIYSKIEEVSCWVLFETDGLVEDVYTFPGDLEDRVYYVVKRTINGQTKRYVETWALESECIGGTLSKLADSFITYSGASTATITGLSHLEGEEVIVWGAGKDLGTYTVAAGSITLSQAVTSCVVGLYYRARYKSSKLAYFAEGDTALTFQKKVNGISFILGPTHYQGLRFGPDFDVMDGLPLVENGKVTDADYVWTSYDKRMIEFPTGWEPDSRFCLEAAAPRCATVMACVVGIESDG